MKVSFHHAGIVVSDLDKAVTFYQKLLGLEKPSRFEWSQSQSDNVEKVINIKDSAARVAMLEGDGFNVELFEYSAPSQTGDPAGERPCDHGIRHIAFQFDDIDAACKRLIDAGGTMHHEPVRLGRTWAIYCRDPFGNIVELMQPAGADT
jgi:catechol 2,3-dioxygenase-like lactoylglutathione lyase family enzyme